MRSNKALTEEALELAEMLGIDVETKGLNNADLVALCKRLRDEVEADPLIEVPITTTPDEDEDEGENEVGPASAPEARASGGYVVAKGRSITSLRGILADGAACSARDFHDGDDAISRLVRLGAVVAR